MQIKVLNPDISEISHATPEEMRYIEYACTQYSSGFRGKKWVKGDPIPVIFNRRFVPTGMIRKIKECIKDDKVRKNHPTISKIDVLDLHNFKYQDLKIEEFMKFVDSLNLEFTPYEYQYRMSWYPIRFGRSFCDSSTSSGKTFISYLTHKYLLHNSLTKKCLIVVPSTLLVDQFANDYIKFDKVLKSYRIYSGAYNEYTEEECEIIVGTFDSLSNKPIEYFQQFNSIFIDEAHRVNAFSIMHIVKMCRHCKVRFGMTGSIPEEPLSIQNIYSYIGYHFETYTSKMLIDAGRAAKITISKIVIQHSEKRIRDLHQILLSQEKPNSEQLIEIKSKVLSVEQLFSVQIKERNRLLSNLVLKLAKTTLILTKRVKAVHLMAESIIEEAEKASIKVNVFVIAGKTNRSREERDAIIQKVELNDAFNVIVANTDIFSTGVSIKTLFYAININSGKSFTTVKQTVGRVMRLDEKHGKDSAHIFDVADSFSINEKLSHVTLNNYNRIGSYLTRHQNERFRIYKDAEFVIHDKVHTLHYEDDEPQN